MTKVLIIVDNNKVEGEKALSVSDYIKLQLKNQDVSSEIIHVNKLNNDSKFYEKFSEYSNILVISSLIVGGASSSLMEFREKLLSGKKEERKKVYFSVIVTHNGINEEYIVDTLNLYKTFAKELGFKWQKGIGVNIAKSVNYKDESLLKKVHEPIFFELDLLAIDIKNNKDYNDFMIINPYLPHKLSEKINKINICIEAIKNKWFDKGDKVKEGA